MKYQGWFAKIWNKIEIIGECWEAQGWSDKDGYRNLWFAGKNWRAHRLIYELYVGELDSNLVIDHLCRNVKCVRPEHLEQVTTQENTKRGNDGIHERNKTHCPRGHEYSGVDKRGKRLCKICHAIQSNESYHRRKVIA